MKNDKLINYILLAAAAYFLIKLMGSTSTGGVDGTALMLAENAATAAG
jgi:hypothetical protein